MHELKKFLLQLPVWLLFLAFIAWLSSKPDYTQFNPEQAMIKLSFSHAGETKEECRRLTPEELANLAPNMRNPLMCNRERVPLFVELTLDDQVIFSGHVPPSGLAKDGESTVYEKFNISPGRHTITARMRDSRAGEGFDYANTYEANLLPKQNFIIDFRKESGGFIFL